MSRGRRRMRESVVFEVILVAVKRNFRVLRVVANSPFQSAVCNILSYTGGLPAFAGR